MLLVRMLYGPVQVLRSGIPVRLPICAVLALMVRIHSSTAEATLIIREHGYSVFS